jgi:hypothetical protein
LEDDSPVIVEDVVDGEVADEDDDEDAGAAATTTPRPPYLSTQPTSLGSTLSPFADPFYPSLGGRSKHRRWADDDSDEFDGDRPSFLEVTLRQARSISMSPVRAQTVPVLGHGGADTGQRPTQRQRRHGRPRPQLVHGLPARAVDG